MIDQVPRDKSNNRVFDDYLFHWLKFVKYLRKTGMSIKAIVAYKALIDQGPATIQKRVQILNEQKAKVQANIKDEQEQIAEIDHKLNNYQSELEKYI